MPTQDYLGMGSRATIHTYSIKSKFKVHVTTHNEPLILGMTIQLLYIAAMAALIYT